ncbi:uncharacterized protein PITG_10542 [Phytophthora infestans T30-4]|uniref:Secreted RxLR effector peptide protein n=1 Tax=Phytophthora infestans (strain T30-4) TaxID=403677 RepID=D0NFK2_PHYIT|nr:uncharacterized protein PITG_10542 [Phytophthora infestans T30-4]EEY56991.1 conserved hypothetical protein [Phytophthora infestans T30-4]|eukprot:XP_002902319.1 conserved hypothetical protein [Phytophthora infestans T30-4]
MARFMTYLALMALAVVAVTSPVSAIPDPNSIARAANAEASTTPESVNNAADTVTDSAATLTDSTSTNTAAAISDSISNVTTETSISASGSESTAGGSTAKASDSASASAAASGSSGSSHVSPNIALVGPTKYGNVIVGLGFIEHVSRTDDQLHNSKDNFYRFTKVLEYDDSAESRSIALATEEALNVLAKVLHKVFERKNKLLFYKGFIACIVDAEAVNVIRIAITHIDAVLIGQVLLDEGLIEPIATAVFTCTVFSTEQLAEV